MWDKRCDDWGLSLVGGVRVVLSWVVWCVVFGGFVYLWFLLRGGVARVRGSTSPQSWRVFLGP
jgi:hypothetical protein